MNAIDVPAQPLHLRTKDADAPEPMLSGTLDSSAGVIELHVLANDTDGPHGAGGHPRGPMIADDAPSGGGRPGEVVLDVAEQTVEIPADGGAGLLTTGHLEWQVALVDGDIHCRLRTEAVS